MFPYIGIMASEEPKTPNSVSGLYNTSDFFSAPSNSVLSDVSLSGLGEFTFMCWVYLISPSSNIIVYRESSSTLRPLYFLGSGSVSVTFDNSNGGVTTLQYPYTREVNEWHHWTVTGSVSNGRLRLYKDGVLVQSAVMTYANETSSSSIIDNDSYYLSQLNIYDRELTESEVAEHYVYDDDLLFEGVLGYDAMTASQRDGLVYSSSYTDTISIAGNEFTDKSGNGVTLSPQPTLTGQQIYVYTDANDLPNGGDVPVIYPVNSMFLAGAGNVNASSSPITSLKDSDQTWSIRFKPDTIGGSGTKVLFTLGSVSNARAFRVYSNGSAISVASYPVIGSTSGVSSITSSVLLIQDQWHTISIQVDISNTLSITVDGVKNSTSMGGLDINATYPVSIGQTGGLFYNTGSLGIFRGWNRLLSDAEIIENELNSNTEYLCNNDLSTGIKNGLIVDVNLGNYNGGTTPLVDNEGTLTFSEIGTVTYTGTGLSVECGGTPTAPSNALPSNLPTIL